MLQITPEPLILLLHTFPSELLSLLTLLVCYIAIIILVKFWQESGLFIYTSIAIIACNLHVLKAMEFSWYNEPIALGTIVYASTFLVSDILTELYGAATARKSIFLSFAASMLMLVFMITALGFKPLINSNPLHFHFNEAHHALLTIFTPNTAILVASFTAYIISQLTDIHIFSKLKKQSGSKLWVRTLSAVTVATLVDTVIFSVLAWRVFAPHPIEWSSIFLTYVLGAYILQMLVTIFNIPVFYLLLKIVRR